MEKMYYFERNRGLLTNLEGIKETKLIDMYVDYFNNFLTVERFAEYYSLTIDSANNLIEIGRKLNNH